jgi:glucosyl-3-phosphoglycerate synthase
VPTEFTEWLQRRTWRAAQWPTARLRAVANRPSVAVILPALNEEATIGPIVTDIRAEKDAPDGFVDDLVVVDSGSTDATAAIAGDCGARVVRREDVLPDIAPVPGKGEAMWRGLAATSAEIVVFIDADLQSFTLDYVSGLVGPLFEDPSLHLVKAVYERPLLTGEKVIPAGGGRVTELVARPLLNRFWPQLAAVVQPLAGEYAGRRALLETLSFPTGYGVEIALLVDTYTQLGLGSIGQVDLGVRVHRHHHSQGLGLMAAEILHAAMSRIPGGETGHPLAAADYDNTLVQFDRTSHGYTPRVRALATGERPPLHTVLS